MGAVSTKRDTDRLNHLLSSRRWVYDVPVDAYVKGQGYRVAIVFENEPGYFPTGDWPYEGRPGQKAPWFWGHDLEEAKAICEAENEKRGISKVEAVKILLSAMGGMPKRRA